MLVVVNTVSFLVHVYSIGYMAEDPHRARFFSYLSFFTFSMLALVTANDFLQLFFGWEGVGVASYLLIGFWYHKRSANDAAIKAFITNRVGDFGFALGIMAAFFCYGSIQFDEVFDAAAANPDLMFDCRRRFQVRGDRSRSAFLLFIGAMGKSAQFFLHVWLPDAMEGPTPVSALIHAATMVTAGVFMVCRCGELYQLAPLASGFVTIIGATTALFAATVGLAQNDIKRVVAYSTCSQLGYMFFAAGVGAYNAAMFHLFTHAFFKALLFLGAGSVIHGLHHEQDMRYMGGVRKPMPITWAMMMIGTLALIGFGIPGTRRLRRLLLQGRHHRSRLRQPRHRRAVRVLVRRDGGVADQLLFLAPRVHDVRRQVSRQSERASRRSRRTPRMTITPRTTITMATRIKPADGSAPAHESPWVMLGAARSCSRLARSLAGAIFAPYFLGEHAEGVLASRRAARIMASHDFPAWVIWAPLDRDRHRLPARGDLLSLATPAPRRRWRRGRCGRSSTTSGTSTRLYDFIFVKGARAIGDLFWKVGDQKIIDGLGPDGVAATSRFFSRQLRRVQTGFVYHYSFIMLIAAVAFGAYAIFAGIGRRAMSEMFAGWPILSIVTFLPAAGALLILLSRAVAARRELRLRQRRPAADADRHHRDVRRLAVRVRRVRSEPARATSFRRASRGRSARPTPWASTRSRCRSSC